MHKVITKKPEVTLFSHTSEPAKTMALAVHAWTSDSIPSCIDDMESNVAEVLSEKAMKAYHRSALEYVDTVWVIKNCSRAFQQQLTRTRIATYAIQSLRVVVKSGFAECGNYTMPPGLSTRLESLFHEQMLRTQHAYQNMMKNGMSAEDARGTLPLNIHSHITMRISLSALYHMLDQRMCNNAQWEYRQVALQMKAEIESKLGVGFVANINPPCMKSKKCPMGDDYCGVQVWKYNNDNQQAICNNFVAHNKGTITWINKPSFIDAVL